MPGTTLRDHIMQDMLCPLVCKNNEMPTNRLLLDTVMQNHMINDTAKKNCHRNKKSQCAFFMCIKNEFKNLILLGHW